MVNINNQKPKIALILTGGGARAAYQVGLLKAIKTILPRNHKSPFDIICGTSAGSINATQLACYASCYHLGVKKLEWAWKHFTTQQVYHCDFRRVFGHILRHFLSNFQSDYATQKPGSLFDNQPLGVLLNRILDLSRIDRNIHGNYLDALCISASSYTDGDSISFFQADHKNDWSRAKRKGVSTDILIEHLLASSAIPLVFPPVKIKQEYYGDGSVHQLSPLSPAIHLGANKIFIIGVDQPEETKFYGQSHRHPGVPYITGHLLDTIFSDTLSADVERMERVNKTLALIPDANRATDLKPIESMMINPSHDFNSIAREHYFDLPMAIRWLLKVVGINKHTDSSLVSYLMFEGSYTQQLIKLGYHDGLEQLDEIKDFLEL
ncbi:MAG: patatin-like phospholipase family protein [Algicola sp.]|nr:patatin-like phospholipase family protein [Algicola sp.]